MSRALFEKGGDTGDQIGGLDRRRVEGEGAGLDAGNIQKVIQKDMQRAGRAFEDLDHLFLTGAELASGERARRADHAVQGRADFMAHCGQELRFGAIGRFGLFVQPLAVFCVPALFADIADHGDGAKHLAL